MTAIVSNLALLIVGGSVVQVEKTTYVSVTTVFLRYMFTQEWTKPPLTDRAGLFVNEETGTGVTVAHTQTPNTSLHIARTTINDNIATSRSLSSAITYNGTDLSTFMSLTPLITLAGSLAMSFVTSELSTMAAMTFRITENSVRTSLTLHATVFRVSVNWTNVPSIRLGPPRLAKSLYAPTTLVVKNNISNLQVTVASVLPTPITTC